jgi:hypothetical protein
MSKKTQTEFEAFDNTMRKLISVPHSEIKAKLDEEKAAKQQRPRKEKSHDKQSCTS